MSVVGFPEPPKRPPLLIGPFTTFHVVVDGRIVPRLTGRNLPDGRVSLTVDDRFCAEFSEDDAHQVAWLIAQASAISAGYPHFEADTKSHPFAPRSVGTATTPADGGA